MKTQKITDLIEATYHGKYAVIAWFNDGSIDLFVVGTKADPHAENVNTWIEATDALRLKHLLKVSGFDLVKEPGIPKITKRTKVEGVQVTYKEGIPFYAPNKN